MTRKFTRHTGIVAPLDVASVDTDAIIPKQFLQKTTRRGFGQHLFHDWRFCDEAGLIPEAGFMLNQPPFRDASILLARGNFGCGSSREHAPWALLDYGFRAIIAPGFADIFYGNSINNQLLPVILTEREVAGLFCLVAEQPGIHFTVDLVTQTVTAGGELYHFTVNDFHRRCLLDGLDSIGLTLQHEAAIARYENRLPLF